MKQPRVVEPGLPSYPSRDDFCDGAGLGWGLCPSVGGTCLNILQAPGSVTVNVATHEGGYGLHQRVGLVLGLGLFIALWFVPPLWGLTEAGTRVAFLGLLMATLWVTEAIPIPATSLLPLVLLPALKISPIRQAAAPYADPVIFLFMGGFMLALAMERWNLHRRLALGILSAIGTKPRALVLGFLCSACFLSMWTSNSATAMMLLPIGVSVYAMLKHHDSVTGGKAAGAAIVLAIAYGANIGGMGTLIGTPPNAILKAYVEKSHQISIGFAQYMLFAIPLILISLPIVYLLLTRFCFRVNNLEVPGIRERLTAERRGLGPISWPESVVGMAFAAAMVAWISREAWKADLPRGGEVLPLGALITDEVIAMAAAVTLFFIPARRGPGVFVLDWEAMKRLPWDVLILFGGGLALAGAMEKTGLVAALALTLEALSDWPVLAVLFLVTFVMIIATAFTSNTATATAFMPVTGALAVALDQPVLLFCVPVALAASADFALPVGTPPNAIAYSSGLVSLPRMVRSGIWVNVLFAVLLPLVMWTVGKWVFDLR